MGGKQKSASTFSALLFFLFSPLLFFLFSPLPTDLSPKAYGETGRELYERLCGRCHGEIQRNIEKINWKAPPIINLHLQDRELRRIIENGIPPFMPGFKLPKTDVYKIISFVKENKAKIKWGYREIRETITVTPNEVKVPQEVEREDIVILVEKGKKAEDSKLKIIGGFSVFGELNLENIHGGVKFFGRFGENWGFVAHSRNGYVLLHDFHEGKTYRARACIYTRNIEVLGDMVFVSCWLPESIVVMDRKLRPLRIIETHDFVDGGGRPTAVKRFGEKLLFAIRRKGIIGIIYVKKQREIEVELYRVPFPVSGFIPIPFSDFIIAESKGKFIKVKIAKGKKDKGKIPSLPYSVLGEGKESHIFSSAYWYSGGSLFIAFPMIGEEKLGVVRVSEEKKKENGTERRNSTKVEMRKFHVDDIGFFIRTHPKNAYLWMDTKTGDSIYLVEKKGIWSDGIRIRKIPVVKRGEKAFHTEFSGDGKLVYISVKSPQGGKVVIYDAIKIIPVAEIPAIRPSGKYNFITKSMYEDVVGYELYMEKCWGCHSINHEAFGPPFEKISFLPISRVKEQLKHPRQIMPAIELTKMEEKILFAFLNYLKEKYKKKHR